MNAPVWRNWFKASFFAVVLAIGCFPAYAQDASQARLLVASPTLQGPYRQTTLIAVPAGGRYFGFILNRATELKLSALFPNHPPSAKVADPVYFGGPVMREALFAVVPRNPGEQALPLFGQLFVTNQAAAIDKIIEQTPNDARYFAGLVVWESGELESEIANGIWYVTEPDAGLVFSRDTGGMWQELVKRLGIRNRPPLAPGVHETKLQAAPPA